MAWWLYDEVRRRSLSPEPRRDIRPGISWGVACFRGRPRIHFWCIEFAQLFHFFEKFVGPRSFFLVHFTEGETDVHQDVVAGLNFRRVFETHLCHNSSEVRLAHANSVRIVRDLDQFTGNRQTHYQRSLRPLSRWPRRRITKPYHQFGRRSVAQLKFP